MNCIIPLLISLLSFLYITSCKQSPSICSKGCQLLYNKNLNCPLKQAFVPTEYITNIEMEETLNNVLTNELYICYTQSNSILSEPQTLNNNAQDTTSTTTQSTMFDLDSYVLIWQAIIIAIIVPLIALLLFKLTLIIFNKIFETLHCRENNHKCCSLCRCCLYCCSAEYRQQKRNRKFHNLANENDINNNNNNNNNNGLKIWKFGRKNNNNNNVPVIAGENDIEVVLECNNDYQHVPLNDIDNNENIGAPNILEEVSVENNDMDKYLQAPGGNNQDIELSFSSQGLRQISYRDVV